LKNLPFDVKFLFIPAIPLKLSPSPRRRDFKILLQVYQSCRASVWEGEDN